MRILITGGAGFIGSHLAELLLSEGAEITALDNLATGRRENIAALESNPSFRFLIGDGQNRDMLNHLVAGTDAVVHLAAAVGVQKVIDEPVETLDTNLSFTQAVLEAARGRGCRVLIASSSEVYGRSAQTLFREDDDLLIGPPTIRRWGYAAGKLVDEFLALGHAYEFDTPVVVMRFFNTVGPRQTGRYGMVVPRFVQAALRGEPIGIYGSGQQRRTFTDVRQSVRAIAELIRHPGAVGEVINLGGTAEVSIEELADKVIAMTGSASEKRFIPYADAYGEHFEDMQRRNPDMTKLRGMLGWAPDAGIEDILDPVIAEHRALLSASPDSSSPTADH